MDLASLLAPFLDAPLPPAQQEQLQSYLELLVKWNARMNLTAVRDEINIVLRHFGESLFVAPHLLPATRLLDVGSGAGFPALPMKIRAPALRVTLVEAQNKKATFLREVVRALGLSEIEVFAGRAEDYAGAADLVTLRAVEKFDRALPVAARLVAPAGRIGLLIGQAQVEAAQRLLPGFDWAPPLLVPLSSNRVLLSGHAPGK